MSKTIVVYGSSTGTCESIAQTIGQKTGAEVIEVVNLSAEQLEGADNILLGTSTWGGGELQDDWYDGVKTIRQTNLSGKKVAIFGENEIMCSLRCGKCFFYAFCLQIENLDFSIYFSINV